MTFKKPELFMVEPPPVDQKELDRINWIDKSFTSVRELFPQWLTADIMLLEFIKKTTDWNIVRKYSDVSIGLGFPFVNDGFTGDLVPMIHTFPPEDRHQVVGICLQLMRDYTPNMEKYYLMNATDAATHQMLSDIRSWEQQIISYGGRSVLDELAFRLGVGGGLSHIKFEFCVDGGK